MLRNIEFLDLCSTPSDIWVKQLGLDGSSEAGKCPLGSTGCNDSHMRREAEVDYVMYKCRMCKYNTLQKKEMEKHLKVHTEEKPLCSSHRPFRANILNSTENTGAVDRGEYLLSIHYYIDRWC